MYIQIYNEWTYQDLIKASHYALFFFCLIILYSVNSESVINLSFGPYIVASSVYDLCDKEISIWTFNV